MLSRHWGCRASAEYRWRGLRLLIMENELLRVMVLLDKGADVVELRYKPRDVDFLWHSPTPLVWGVGEQASVLHPEGPFADYYEGGWQEVLPNAGRFCEWQGARFGLHGEVWALPWECRLVEDTPQQVVVELAVRCRRMPLKLVRVMKLVAGRACLQVEEKLTNESPVELAVMWGHHPAYGPPFLSPACRLDMPPCQVVVDEKVGEASRCAPGQQFAWPRGQGREGQEVDLTRIPGPAAAVDEMYYLTDLQEPWYAVANEELGLTLGVAWRGRAFRCVWYWASLHGNRQWPSWGRFYAIALEPMSSWPALLTNAIAKGTELRLEPEQTVEEELTAAVAEGAEAVGRVTLEGEILPRP
jgi:galactose mutarotase-like enzyme